MKDEPEDFYGIENVPVPTVSKRSLNDDVDLRQKFRPRFDDTDFLKIPTEFVEKNKLPKQEFLEKNKDRKFAYSNRNRGKNDFLSDVYEERYGNDSYETQKTPRIVSNRGNFRHEEENVEELLEIEKSRKPKKVDEFIKKIKNEKSLEKIKEVQEKDEDGSLLNLHKLWSLIPDVMKMTNDELVQLLLDRVIFNKHEIIALDKPYGLPSIPGPGFGRNRALSNFLEPLRQVLAPGAKRLFLAHRLDRTTTGVIIMTTNEERFLEFKKMFREKRIIKKYLAITRSIPDPQEGIIKIPLGSRLVGNRNKMIPIPTKNDENRSQSNLRDRNGEIFDAVTEFKVLSTAQKCALVETLIPTGVQHQIRSHLGFGIGCPVLGDHKYSNFLQYKPQCLPAEMLHKLGIRSSKSRHLPIFLHAKELILPEYVDGSNLFIRANVPKFFKYAMKKLRLHFPK